MNNKFFLSGAVFLMVFVILWIGFAKIYPRLPDAPSYSEAIAPQVKPDALTLPLAGVYKVINDQVVKIGELRDGYFPCVILKQIKIGDQSFVLIRIEQHGLSPDILMVQEKSVVILEQKVAARMTEVN